MAEMRKLLTLGVLLLCARPAWGSLTINLRFDDGSNQRTLTSADLGKDITVQAWATIDGTGGTNGSGSLMGLQNVFFSVGSQRMASGAANSVDGSITGPTLTAPFNDTNSQLGALHDFNGDTVGDLGQPSSTEADTNYIFARNQNRILSNNSSAIGRAITNGYEFLIETFKFHITSVPTATVSGAGTRLSPLIPDATAFGLIARAQWWQNTNGSSQLDGVNNGLNSGDLLAGTSVAFSLPFVVLHPWQNQTNIYDVDQNGRVEPLDVLLIINELNLNGPHDLLPPTGTVPYYYDVTGDDRIQPVDVLQIINYINLHNTGVSAGPLMVLVPEPSSYVLGFLGLCGILALRRR